MKKLFKIKNTKSIPSLRGGRMSDEAISEIRSRFQSNKIATSLAGSRNDDCFAMTIVLQ